MKVRFLLLILAVLPLACGGDDATTSCDGGACEDAACTPRTCAEAAAECGALDDGCGGALDCGDACADEEPWLTCGGGGAPNTCGATCELPCPGGSSCDGNGVCSYVPVVTLDATAHEVTFRFLLDGAQPTDTAACTNPTTIGTFSAGNLDAVGGSTSGVVRCGTQWTAGPFVLPRGTYRVSLRGESWTNVPTTTTTVDVTVASDGEIVVDVPTVRVRGTVVLGGSAPAEINCSAGELVGTVELRNAGSQTSVVPIACGSGFSFDARVFPGAYTVIVRKTARSNLPIERLVVPLLQVSTPIDGLVLDAGEQPTVSGTLRLGGAAPTTAPGCGSFNEGARLSFYQGDTLVAFTNFPCSGPFTYAIQLVPGTYRVRARSIANSGINEPSFEYADLPPLVVGAAPVVYDVDVPLVEVTGTLTLGGQTPTEDASCAGNAAFLAIGLRNVPVPCGTGFSFGPARFVPGTYGVLVSAGASTNLPHGASATLVVPPQGGPVVVDLRPMHQLRLRLTVDGAAPDDGGCTGGEVARVNLRSVGGTGGFYTGFGIACGAGFEASATVPAGDYALELAPAGLSNIPLYAHPVTIAVQADTTVDVDIPTRTVSGTIAVNGAAPVETAACTAGLDVAEVVFTDAHTIGSSTVVARSACGSGFTFGPLALGAGVYRVIVRPLGPPARSDLPTSNYIAIPRFAVQ